MKNYQPYTYLIRFILTRQLYYGVRWAKGCHPDEFWVKYFTTSKVIKKMINEFGKDSFEVLYTKNHATKESALKWEEMYLVSVDAGYNENYLNKHNGGKNFCVTEESSRKCGLKHRGKIISPDVRLKLSIAALGRIESEETKHRKSESLMGHEVSEETREKIRKANSGENNHWYGVPKTEEYKEFLKHINAGEGNAMYGLYGKENPTSKHYIITFPDGNEEFVIGMAEFCRNYKLNKSHMCQVAKSQLNGLRKHTHHKDFKCRYATEQEILDNLLSI